MLGAKATRTWFVVHQWSSLVPTLFLLMLCITGLPLIFAHEIDHFLGYEVEVPVRELSTAEPVRPVDAVIAEAKALYPEGEVQFVVGHPGEPELLSVRLGPNLVDPDIVAYLTWDLRSTELLQDYPLGEGIMNVMLHLHVDMFLGLGGTLFLGAMGVLLLVSLVSGAVLYAPFMRKLGFGTIRRHRSPRLKWLDLHNLLGIATLVWLFVVGATGIVSTLSVPLFAAWQQDALRSLDEHSGQLAAPQTELSVDEVLASAMKAVPRGELNFAAFPGSPFATSAHYTVFMQGDTPLRSNLLTVVLIDAVNGSVVETKAMPWYVQALMLSKTLHFGDYGGLLLKGLWFLFDLLAIVILASGVYLWVARRRYAVGVASEFADALN